MLHWPRPEIMAARVTATRARVYASCASRREMLELITRMATTLPEPAVHEKKFSGKFVRAPLNGHAPPACRQKQLARWESSTAIAPGRW